VHKRSDETVFDFVACDMVLLAFAASSNCGLLVRRQIVALFFTPYDAFSTRLPLLLGLNTGSS
jgi:hypothetical protein